MIRGLWSSLGVEIVPARAATAMRCSSSSYCGQSHPSSLLLVSSIPPLPLHPFTPSPLTLTPSPPHHISIPRLIDHHLSFLVSHSSPSSSLLFSKRKIFLVFFRTNGLEIDSSIISGWELRIYAATERKKKREKKKKENMAVSHTYIPYARFMARSGRRGAASACPCVQEREPGPARPAFACVMAIGKRPGRHKKRGHKDP